jgi:signal transduction histidine kinase
MKRKKLWILAILIILLFGGLVTLQVKNLIFTWDRIDTNFNARVQQALYQSERDIEELEIEHYLKKTIEENTPEKVKKSFSESFHSIKLDKKPLTVTEKKIAQELLPIRNSSLQKASDILFEQYKERFYRSKVLLDQVALSWMNEAPTLDLKERIDFNDIADILETEFEKNKIQIAYSFGILNKDKEFIYISDEDKRDELLSEEAYKQLLFPDEPSENEYTLRVYFPTKRDYLITTLHLLIPSLLLLGILVIIILYTFYIFLKQAKLTTIKTDFMNTMTHELKTPISTVLLASQMLQDKDIEKTPERVVHFSKLIAKESQRLRFLVDKVLQVTVLDKANHLMNFSQADINELIKKTIPSIELNVEKDNGKVIFELNAKNPWVMIDTTHFSNVIYNLMENAIKYKKKDTPLVLKFKTRNNRDRVIISVEDNGIGVKKEYQKEIFDKLYRVPTGYLHNVKGFGLGLAYVKQIIDKHKGTISIESEYNIGTKFIISLPNIKL